MTPIKGAHPKHTRIVGLERRSLTTELVERYTRGESIRSLATSIGRSYGAVHRLLSEGGIQFRPRGGARVRNKAASSHQAR